MLSSKFCGRIISKSALLLSIQICGSGFNLAIDHVSIFKLFWVAIDILTAIPSLIFVFFVFRNIEFFYLHRNQTVLICDVLMMSSWMILVVRHSTWRNILSLCLKTLQILAIMSIITWGVRGLIFKEIDFLRTLFLFFFEFLWIL